MDRSVLESDPHRVLEGMAIAGYAVGASRGYIYCRAEYPLAVARLKTAIRLAGRAGLLGVGIAGALRVPGRAAPGRGRVRLWRGDGPDRLGPGRTRHPRPRPPYPAVSGLWGSPTLINNPRPSPASPRSCATAGTGTPASAPPPARGPRCSPWPGGWSTPAWSRCRWGSPCARSSTTSAAASSRAAPSRPSRPAGRPAAASAQYLDMPVDYESLKEVGSIMGSGGMIVMDDTACMVDVARYFMDFCREESCGKCIPCRVGTTQLHTLLTSICEGIAPAWTTWSSWSGYPDMVKRTSLYGLGERFARCSRPCATSARSTWPMSRTGPARPGSARSPTGRRCSAERLHPARRRHRCGRRRRQSIRTWPPRTASRSRPCATWTASAASAPADCASSRSAPPASSCRPVSPRSRRAWR